MLRRSFRALGGLGANAGAYIPEAPRRVQSVIEKCQSESTYKQATRGEKYHGRYWNYKDTANKLGAEQWMMDPKFLENRIRHWLFGWMTLTTNGIIALCMWLATAIYHFADYIAPICHSCQAEWREWMWLRYKAQVRFQYYDQAQMAVDQRLGWLCRDMGLNESVRSNRWSTAIGRSLAAEVHKQTLAKMENMEGLTSKGMPQLPSVHSSVHA
eukprot:TRINITY_DN5476_c0_g1_i1.p1 TRINITY_DN5476_c0_g1~~TRINITY_DN5476_c0_g1_i1.p1  ORF type:complete len:213 (-),score=5.83 TRINITY_DN5476_c0_g1_i1:67-705(-)